jgi:hypothetical protein
VVSVFRKHNLLNRRFGRWIVVGDRVLQKRPNKERGTRLRPAWLCRCDCGKEREVLQSSLLQGRSLSCGCLAAERAAEWHKGKVGGRRLPQGEAGFNLVWSHYTRAAKDRGLSWALSKDEFRTLVLQPCAYCGGDLSNEAHSAGLWSSFKYNGIDRVDNDLGYSPSNCVTACVYCNRGKLDRNADEFFVHIRKQYEHLSLKNWQVQ